MKLTALGAYLGGKLRLPPGYHLECDAEVLTLCRRGGSIIAAFGTDVTPSVVARIAEEDYRTHGKSSA